MRTPILVALVIAFFFGIYWIGSTLMKQQREKENRLKVERNLRFDDLERAYWPTPLDLKGKKVLIFEYDGIQPCNDVCSILVNGTADAEVFYALYRYTDAPNFVTPIDLGTLVQGRVKKDETNQWKPILEELRKDEPKPVFDYVIIQMSKAVAPIVSRALEEFDLEPSWGAANMIIAPVSNSQSFQLDHKQMHSATFYRSVVLGHYNSRRSSYSFKTGIDSEDVKMAVGEMLHSPWMMPSDEP